MIAISPITEHYHYIDLFVSGKLAQFELGEVNKFVRVNVHANTETQSYILAYAILYNIGIELFAFCGSAFIDIIKMLFPYI